MARLLTMSTQSVAVGRGNEDDNIEILVQSMEEAPLAEEKARIDDEKDDGELDVENEGSNSDGGDHDSDDSDGNGDGEEIDDDLEV